MIDGEISYYQKQSQEGRTNFYNSILSFSNALLNEINQVFWLKVSRDSNTKKELEDLGLQRNRKLEWGDLIKILRNTRSLKNTFKAAMKNRIRVDILISQQGDMEFLRDKGRTKAAHVEQVDEKTARDLYKRLQTGMMKKILGSLHGESF